MTPDTQELTRLREGNKRFLSGHPSAAAHAERRIKTAKGQSPFAVIIGCADSRVPPETIFDQGIGDLFVIRIAGNVASDEAVGSAEFAVGQLGAKLVVVLGHSSCGAVEAAVRDLQSDGLDLPERLRSIVDRIRPTAAHEADEAPTSNEAELVARAIRANVRSTCAGLLASPVLAAEHGRGELEVVGAEYYLTTGRVEFFHSE